jgi:predicted small secreted protein
MKKMLYIALILNFVLVVAGCNTMRGFGTDIKRGGEAIEGAAK